jgi:hypothetical protein
MGSQPLPLPVITIFLGITSVIMLIISSIIINDYRTINSWKVCECNFANSTILSSNTGYYAYVKISAVADCPSNTDSGTDSDLVDVSVQYPPGGDWYNRNSDVLGWASLMLEEKKNQCSVDLGSDSSPKNAVTQNIINFGWYGFLCALGIICGIVTIIFVFASWSIYSR